MDGSDNADVVYGPHLPDGAAKDFMETPKDIDAVNARLKARGRSAKNEESTEKMLRSQKEALEKVLAPKKVALAPGNEVAVSAYLMELTIRMIKEPHRRDEFVVRSAILEALKGNGGLKPDDFDELCSRVSKKTEQALRAMPSTKVIVYMDTMFKLLEKSDMLVGADDPHTK